MSQIFKNLEVFSLDIHVWLYMYFTFPSFDQSLFRKTTV